MSDTEGERIARLEAKIDMLADSVRAGNNKMEALHEQGKAITVLQLQSTSSAKDMAKLRESHTWWKRTVIGAAIVAVMSAATTWWIGVAHSAISQASPETTQE